MAFFIVIGTNGDVKDVVDEIKRSHLQHNVITSGCVLRVDDGLYYHWDVFNENGEKTSENRESIELHDALTNQISQFRTLLPDNAIPNVFIVSKCFDEAERSMLQMVCGELYQIGGATLSGLMVDIVLLGYDLNRPEDVTIRPHWRLLESIRGLEEGGPFHTNILYVNNMDYMGAATNVAAPLLSRFLCHWSKMVCSGGYDPKSTVHSHVYAIGMSEHQYDFRNLNDFFKLSAEESLLDRRLNNHPSGDTQELLDTNNFKKIDLDLPWIDGLQDICSIWRQYCSAQWNPSKPLADDVYSVTRQELLLSSYLNEFLKMYIAEEQRDIDKLLAEVACKETEKNISIEKLRSLEGLPYEDETKLSQIRETTDEVESIETKIDELNREIQRHRRNISRNSFVSANDFYTVWGTKEPLTEEDEADYASGKSSVERLLAYVKTDEGVSVMREAVGRATVLDTLPNPYPASAVLNMGRVKEIVLPKNQIPALPSSSSTVLEADSSKERPGCLLWFKSIFCKKTSREDALSEDAHQEVEAAPASISEEQRLFLGDKLAKSVAALRKADDVRCWWDKLVQIIDAEQKRRGACRLLMDGEKNINGVYIAGKEGYRITRHRKSVSLIDMNRVRDFRDNNMYYKQMINQFIDRWFDKATPLDERMTMPELIKHQVLDALVGKYHTLKWDGENPFVKEEITDDEMHEYIEHDLSQSKPFVEYVRVQESNLISNLTVGFFSNNSNIPIEPNDFRQRYNISSDSIRPTHLADFVNSLAVVQVLDIPDHVDALKDFKPRRESALSSLRSDIQEEVAEIICNATSVEERAKAIYDWICANIAYDTSGQIHDAETCYRTRRGVCQAYCELFCYMAGVAGITADIIIGKTKGSESHGSEKHAWVFVYTHAYKGIFIDPTWGAGSVKEARFVRNDNPSVWFDVSPYWMIFSHFPDDPYWAKLDISVNEEQFEKLPVVEMISDTDGKDLLFECLSKIK